MALSMLNKYCQGSEFYNQYEPARNLRNYARFKCVDSQQSENETLPRDVFSMLSRAFYGKCVAATTTGKQELTKNTCAKEFEALKSCFQSAMKKAVK